MGGFKFKPKNHCGMRRADLRILFLAVLTSMLTIAVSYSDNGLSLDGFLRALGLFPLISIFAGAVLFVLYMIGPYIRLFRSTPFQSWDELVPEKSRSGPVGTPRYVLGLAVSALLFFFVFLVYLSILWRSSFT
jgi:hypothetical protein